MEKTDFIMIVVCSFVVMLGLIFVILQKNGKIRPKAIITSRGIDFTSGGTIVFLGTVLGAIMLYKYSVFWTILYVTIIAGIYVFIQIVYRK